MQNIPFCFIVKENENAGKIYQPITLHMVEVSRLGDTGFLKAPRPQKKGDAKWRDIEDLINRWAKRNPQAALLNEQWIKEAREGLKDKKYAAGDIGRWGVSIHPELMNYIQAFYPDFMDTKKDLHEFMKRFKKFRIPEKT